MTTSRDGERPTRTQYVEVQAGPGPQSYITKDNPFKVGLAALLGVLLYLMIMRLIRAFHKFRKCRPCAD